MKRNPAFILGLLVAALAVGASPVLGQISCSAADVVGQRAIDVTFSPDPGYFLTKIEVVAGPSSHDIDQSGVLWTHPGKSTPTTETITSFGFTAEPSVLMGYTYKDVTGALTSGECGPYTQVDGLPVELISFTVE